MNLKENVGLHKLTTIGTGGPARWFGRPETAQELVEMLFWAEQRSIRWR